MEKNGINFEVIPHYIDEILVDDSNTHKSLIKKAKSQHLEDFSALEKMRKDVDEKQSTYDQKVREFKTDIGLTTDVVNNLMVGIYNKFQDEILEHSKRNKK